MKTLRKEKNWNNFLDKIKNMSQSSVYSIIKSNERFDDFCIKNYKKSKDEIIMHAKTLNLEDSEETILDVLQEYLNQLHSEKLVVQSIKIYISCVNRYLKYHKIKIDLKDLQWPQQLQEEPHAISIQEIHQIFDIASWKKKAYYLSLISTGARPIEILGLRKKDITWNSETRTYTAIIPAKLTKKKMARTIKFSHEVTPYLGKLLSDLADDSQIFTKNPNLRNARVNEDMIFSDYCKKIGLTQKYETTGRNKVNLYCFRGYFFTKAQRLLGDETAHALIGHGAYLQQYQRRTLEEKIDLWDELESEILIFDLEKKNKEIKKLKEANQQLELMQERIDKLEQISQIRKQFSKIPDKEKQKIFKN